MRCVAVADFLINSPEARHAAAAAVNSITREPMMMVTIAEYSDDRSAAQNRLYWAFMHDCERTGCNEHAGNTKDYWHRYFKSQSLLNIFIRDDVDGISETMGALYEVKQACGVEVYNNMRKFVVDNISTTDANIKQFTEYLSDIQRFCSSVGIVLRTDSADFKRAMGARQVSDYLSEKDRLYAQERKAGLHRKPKPKVMNEKETIAFLCQEWRSSHWFRETAEDFGQWCIQTHHEEDCGRRD